ncbi:MAG TPA: tRNA lysidine(34) synthetase TilS, partial [Longimicrobiales bacterium]
MSIESRLLALVRARNLIKPADRVLVAVSGGVDSVVLLHLLRATAEPLHIELTAAHFDHAMRPDSAADAEWVEDLCSTWRVPLVLARASRELRSEDEARSERYRFLYQAMRSSGALRVATAHHADDQIETVLFRLLRGAGLRGLSGIPLRRGPFIRPLLRFYKHELLAYAAAHELGFRPDATNEQLRFMRNRIRHVLLPPLLNVYPRAKPAVLALARHAAQTEAAWHATLLHLERELLTSDENERIELARGVLLEYHPALRARVMRHLLRRFGTTPSRASTRHILQFCCNADSGSMLEVAGRVRIERAF